MVAGGKRGVEGTYHGWLAALSRIYTKARLDTTQSDRCRSKVEAKTERLRVVDPARWRRCGHPRAHPGLRGPHVGIRYGSEDWREEGKGRIEPVPLPGPARPPPDLLLARARTTSRPLSMREKAQLRQSQLRQLLGGEPDDVLQLLCHIDVSHINVPDDQTLLVCSEFFSGQKTPVRPVDLAPPPGKEKKNISSISFVKPINLAPASVMTQVATMLKEPFSIE